MKIQPPNNGTDLSKKSKRKDQLQVRGDLNLSIGVRIFGMENANKREKILRVLVIASLILATLIILILVNNDAVSERLAKIIDQLILLLQTIVSSKELLKKSFKQEK